MTQQTDPLGLPRQHTYIPERGTYVPSWCPWDSQHWPTHVEVSHEKNMVGYKVSDVLPERRWAIQESGEMLEQREFEDRYKKYLSGFALPSTFDINAEAIPLVHRYVGVKLDPVSEGRLIPMDYDPFKKKTTESDAKYNQQGEVSIHYLKEQQEKSDKLLRMEQLTGLMKQGIISSKQYLKLVAEMEKDETPEPAPEPVTEPVPEKTVEMVTSLCGVDRPAGNSIRMHERKCKKCISIREERAMV